MVEEISYEANEAINQDRTPRAWLLELQLKPEVRRRLTIGGQTASKRYIDAYEHLTDWEEPLYYPKSDPVEYHPMPIEMPDFHLESSDKVQTNEITVSFISSKFAQWLDEQDGLVGHYINALLVVPGYMREEDVLHRQLLRIKKSSTNGKTARFEVTTSLDQFDKTITRLITRDQFPHIPQRRTIIQ